MSGILLKSPATGLVLERVEETVTHCECCGNDTQHVTWRAYETGADGLTPHATVTARWTIAHACSGALLCIALGDRTTRIAVHSFFDETGIESYMVRDASEYFDAGDAITNLRRDQVIATPLATQTFRIIDALHEADGQFRGKWHAGEDDDN